MKLLLVFNERQDIVFYKGKRNFMISLLSTCLSQCGFQNDTDSSAHRAQDVSSETAGSDMDTINLLVQHFAPLLASQQIMSSKLSNSYASIHLENNLALHMRQLGDYNVIALCDLEELPDPKQQLQVFERLARAFYGPCLEQLKPASLSHRSSMWRFFGSVFQMWMQLYRRDFAFLFEAVENVLITSSSAVAAGHTSNTTWRGRSMLALERAINKYKLNAEAICQVYVVCGTKRFCLYTPEGKGIELTPDNYLIM